MEVIMALGEPTIAQFSHMMNLSTPNAAYKINSLVFKTAEDLFIKMQLEFCVYLPKCLIQHGENPPVG